MALNSNRVAGAFSAAVGKTPFYESHRLRMILLACIISAWASLLNIAWADQRPEALATRLSWIMVRSPNFTIFSSGAIDQTRQLTLSLEQFREVYWKLTGLPQLPSAPVLVLAFTNQAAFAPFAPFSKDQNSRVRGFFNRDNDENTIALDLQSTPKESTAVIFHEFAHYLMRQNHRTWPRWLSEGVAEVYSTFVADGKQACLGGPKEQALQQLRKSAPVSVKALFEAGGRANPGDEGGFAAEFYPSAWLLTQYLMFGNKARQSQYSDFTKRLRAGQEPAPAFQAAFQTDFSTMDSELARYLTGNSFARVCFDCDQLMSSTKVSVNERVARVEILYQLGNLMLHRKRFDSASNLFEEALAIAPQSPRPFEGLGLLAARQGGLTSRAIQYFDKARAQGSSNPRLDFEYGRILVTTESGRINTDLSATQDLVRGREALIRACRTMPWFAPAPFLLGLVEMQTAKNANQAEAYAQTAVRLDPDNDGYRLFLAQVQLFQGRVAAARQTAQWLLRPDTDPAVRAEAQNLLSRK